MQRGSFNWKIKTDLVCLLKLGHSRKWSITHVAEKYQLSSEKVVRAVYNRHIRPQFRRMIEQTGRVDRSALY